MDNEKSFSRQDFDDLFSLAYEELRRLAATVKQGDQSATLNPTALVNEAWLRLREARPLAFESTLHFKRIAARAMRQILIEAARRRHARKRTAPPMEEPVFTDDVEVLALEEALQELESLNPRQANLVEARFFGGLEVSELTEAFAISEATVMRDWRMARAFLAQRMKGQPLEMQ